MAVIAQADDEWISLARRAPNLPSSSPEELGCYLTDATNLFRLIHDTHPIEIFNLAAESHFQVSFKPRE
jgi:GDP-D-mannose dehydratase